MSRAWVQALCGAPERTYVATPYAAEVDGEQWDCATDGYVILMLRGPSEFAGKPRVEAPPVGPLLAVAYGEPVEVSFGALRSWAYSSETCDECPVCGRGEPAPAPGFLCGRLVNRRLVWKAVSLVGSETVRVSVGPDKVDPVLIDGGTWRAVVAALVLDPEETSDAPRFP